MSLDRSVIGISDKIKEESFLYEIAEEYLLTSIIARQTKYSS
jgi:hypothetical protein